MRRRSVGLPAAVLAVMLALPMARAEGAAPASGAASGHDWRSVTLVTGDRVLVADGAGGRRLIRVEPGTGRGKIPFHEQVHGKEVSVIPADAAPMVAQGRLDRHLFEVTRLLRDGYGDASRKDLPLIVSDAPAPALAGTRTTRTLSAVNGAAVQAGKDRSGGFWKTLRGRASNRTRVWLDAKVHAVLDQSVPQIGAPDAWAAGYTGKGVTVGVLDSGIDTAHPDLADTVTVAKDFTGGDNGTQDGYGHGTHVASIITGSGAASGGRYKGVAPDARLVVGKVLDGNGNGAFSQVMAGMEWIATQGARVVNMSLSTDIASDGTDPLSAELNTLTARTGTLFVVGAGNQGGDRSVGVPAVADAALTVGAVDHDNALAEFSSAGPRIGDGAVKPDVTAPGVGIVAARAHGTEMGEPVGDDYTRLSGTSMATPHVAGAAAILAQEHPDWKAGDLKAALMNTAVPNSAGTVFQQGAGRIDLKRGVSQTLWAAPGSVSAHLTEPDSTTATRQVTFRNDGSAALDLDLALTVNGPDGEPAPAGMFGVDADHLTVPAHGTATTTIKIDGAPGAAGRYSGRLTATSSDGRQKVAVAVGAVREPRLHTISVAGIDRNGASSGRSLESLPWGELVDLDTGTPVETFVSGGRVTARVPTGRYALNINVDTVAADGTITDSTLFSEPELNIDHDVQLTVDARRGRRIAAKVDSPTAVQSGTDVTGIDSEIAGQTFLFSTVSENPALGLYAIPTKRVTSRPYSFFYKTTLAEPLGAGSTARAYHLALLTKDHIPDRPVYRLHDGDLATLDARYHSAGKALTGTRDTVAILPGETFPLGMGSYDVRLPGGRTELYSVTPGVRWYRELIGSDGATPVFLEAGADPALTPGRRVAYDWNEAVGGPIAHASKPCRNGRTFTTDLLTPPNGSSYATNLSDGAATPVQEMTLRRDGEVIGSTEGAGACFTLPSGSASYTLHATARRDAPWTPLGSSTDVTWTFGYDPEPRTPQNEPRLPALRVSGAFDQADRAPSDATFRLGIRADDVRISGTTPPAVVMRTVTVETSFDDGKTWRQAPVSAAGADRWTADVRHPAAGTGSGYVSIRLHADDGAGDAVDQTVIRAYALR
ncbi:S8 family peptidase [Actinoallomurus spadix]|uniref:S8 family serine peptidase n=1 Tax=Actinoallomurus spadix TaxID=79912 RepID=A0ABN0WEV5_9ACTN|nr:S8 family peptidase [Actinoallomurus spadix]MCO5987299.1 S8 family peptidase [Actinoallomurus spadix]